MAYHRRQSVIVDGEISDWKSVLSADMKVSEQCGIAAVKENQILRLIMRTFTYKEKQLIVPL